MTPAVTLLLEQEGDPLVLVVRVKATKMKSGQSVRLVRQILKSEGDDIAISALMDVPDATGTWHSPEIRAAGLLEALADWVLVRINHRFKDDKPFLDAVFDKLQEDPDVLLVFRSPRSTLPSLSCHQRRSGDPHG